jgi:hypothetical protein
MTELESFGKRACNRAIVFCCGRRCSYPGPGPNSLLGQARMGDVWCLSVVWPLLALALAPAIQLVTICFPVVPALRTIFCR